MERWADGFFVEWQKAWGTGTEAVLEFVTDDIEYWDVTLAEPIHGRDAYGEHCDSFFTAFTECEWSMREPVIVDGDRVTEPWAFTGINSGRSGSAFPPPAGGSNRRAQPVARGWSRSCDLSRRAWSAGCSGCQSGCSASAVLMHLDADA